FTKRHGGNMNKQSLRLLAVLFCCIFTANTVLAQTTQSLPPNDQWYNPLVGQQMRFAEALFLIDQKERTTGANFNDIVVLVLDKPVDYTHRDIAENCLVSLFRDFTQPNPLNLGLFSTHGTGTAGNIGGIGNNGIGVATASLSP